MPPPIRVRPRQLSIDVASAAVLGVIGDVACQLGERQVAASSGSSTGSSSLDARRIAAVGVYGAFYTGAFCNVLYQTYPHIVGFLARRLTTATSTLRAPLLRETSAMHNCSVSVVDNVHCGLIYLPSFFLGVGVLKGDTVDNSTANLRREWRDSYVSCTLFWMPFMAYNFAFVPAHGASSRLPIQIHFAHSPAPFAGRVRAMAAANCIWNVVIDYIFHRE
jgi:protein Mpv17